MGAYLSTPVTNKISSDDTGKNVAFGASSMQGWRVSQEDAHNCCIDFDENMSLFAVYDGHGGHEVATYCASKLPEFIKQTDAYKKGDIRQALIDAFLGFDATLAKPEIVKILKEISSNKSGNNSDDSIDQNESDDEDNVSNLRKEAEMPLEQVMAKYQADNPQFKLEKFPKRAPIVASPYLRCRRARDKSSGSSCSSGAGCSSSSSSWSTSEADVSSSSQQACGSTTEETKTNTPGSSDSDQVLDSTTTSNGELSHDNSTEKKNSTKSEDMPDSSEDIGDNVSPSKSTIIDDKKEKTVDLNGSETKKASSTGDNVSSSSSGALENGEIGQQEGITSSSLKNEIKVQFYRILQKNFEGSEEDDEEDDDDENDETFDGVPGEADDDDDEDEEKEEGEDADDDSEDLDDDDCDDDEDDDEFDEDDDDSDENSEFPVTEEPGSDSGCTAVVAVLKGNDLYVANAGDSRCVLCRDGQALELSLDHKPEDEPEMKRIVKAGGKVTADGRVNGGLNLSRALGDHAYKQNNELPAQEQMISALPDIKHVSIEPDRDEFMVLACDGIWNYMSSSDVIKFVRERINTAESLSKICEELFDHCLAPDAMGDGTGCDNMTAVIVKFNSFNSTEKNNTNDGNTVAVSKKRPVSPSKSIDDDDGVTSEKPLDECKRAKLTTV